MRFIVHPDGRLVAGDRVFPCVLGRGGVRADKREGDGATPVGVFPLRRVLFRPDRRVAPRTGLATGAIAPDDGWCDEPGHADYNRPVKRPFPASHEIMWRDDRLYDVVVLIGHNDDPPVPFAGSAVFIHLERPDRGPTAGCVALSPADMDAFLAMASPGDEIEILAP